MAVNNLLLSRIWIEERKEIANTLPSIDVGLVYETLYSMLLILDYTLILGSLP